MGGGTFPLKFSEIPSSISDVLRVRRPQAPTTQVVKLDEGGNVVKRTVEASPNFTTVREMFRPWSVPFFQGTSISSSVSMSRERSPSLKAISSTRKKARTFSLPPVAPSQMASITPEAVQEVPSSSSLELSSAASKHTRSSFLIGFKSICNINDVPFQELLDGMEQSGEVITEGVKAVLTILPTTHSILQSLPIHSMSS